MNPSYFRIKLTIKEATERLCKWIEKSPKETIESTFAQSVAHSLGDKGEWKGSCLYTYENEGWAVFEDLSGGFSAIPAESWLGFAEGDELVVAGYNDSTMYGELIVIKDGMVQKEFLEFIDTPQENVNRGDMYTEIKDWADAAQFVDDDEIVYSDNGVVIVF